MKKLNTANFSTLVEDKNLTNYWPREAEDFTPWLAEKENLLLLTNELNLPELDVVTTEKHVGPYRADIFCVDPITNNYTVIENQLTKTDHSHFGQIFTYMAGLGATTGIWVAKRFTDEHIKAINLLNEITSDEYDFYAVEISVLKINDMCAPNFKIVAKPDTTYKTTHKTKISSLEESRINFVKAYRDYLADNFDYKLKFVPGKKMGNSIYDSVGRSRYSVGVSLYEKQNKIRISFNIDDDPDNKQYEMLYAKKDEIEKHISNKIIWDGEYWEDKKKTAIYLDIENCDITNDETWESELFPKLKKYHIDLFINYFREEVKNF